MISIIQLYKIAEEERMKLLSFFKKIDEKHFYFSPKDNVWSSEQIFRHLLINIKWILDKLPGEKIEKSSLAIDLDEDITKKYSLEEIIKELNIYSSLLSERLSLLSAEEEDKQIDTWRGKLKLGNYIVRLINHEHRHLGHIQWLLKRSTGWTDKEIYTL